MMISKSTEIVCLIRCIYICVQTQPKTKLKLELQNLRVLLGLTYHSLTFVRRNISFVHVQYFKLNIHIHDCTMFVDWTLFFVSEF